MSPYDPNLWFVATDMGILFRSSDSGRSWTPVDQNYFVYHSNLDYSTPIGFCADPNVVLFSNRGEVCFRSTDKGVTWSPVSITLETDERVKYWVPNSEDPNMILCATNQRLLKTTNKGVSWAACGITGASRGTLLDYQEGHIYHATTEGIFRSSDAGKTFSSYHIPNVLPLHAFAGGRDTHGLTLAYVDGDGVNAVGSWMQPLIGRPDGASQDSYDRSVATSGYVWVKRAGMTDFTTIAHEEQFIYNGTVIHTSYQLYGSGNIRLANTAPFQIPITQHNTGHLYMAENDSQTIYITGNNYWPRAYGSKVFVTENAGQTWEKRYHCQDYDNSYLPWPADKLEWSAVGMEIGWWDGFFESFTINQRNASMAGGTGWFFLHTTENKGHKWRAPFTEFADTAPRAPGKKWRSTGLEVTNVYRLRFHPNDPSLMYAGLADIQGYVSEDGGDTVRIMTRIANSAYDFAFDPDDDHVVYAAIASRHDWPNGWSRNVNNSQSSGGIYRSNDRGRTWTRLTPDNTQFGRDFLSVAYDKARNIVYGGAWGAGIARSVNGGAWEYINSGIFEGNGRIIGHLHLDADGNVYALLSGDHISGVSSNRTHTGIYFLDVQNNATSWQLLRGTLHGSNDRTWLYPTCFAVDPSQPNTLWLGDDELGGNWMGSGIWKSTDRGANWHQIFQFTRPRCILIDPANTNRVHLSGLWEVGGTWGNGGLYHTTDGGISWTKNDAIGFRANAVITAYDPNDPKKLFYTFMGAGILHGPRPDVPQDNLPPILSPIGNQSIQEGSPLIIQIHATDPDNDPLTYSATGN